MSSDSTYSLGMIGLASMLMTECHPELGAVDLDHGPHGLPGTVPGGCLSLRKLTPSTTRIMTGLSVEMVMKQ